MKDKAISSLSKANSKSKLAREGANAKRNKRGVVRRSNYSGGLSSSKGISQFNAGGTIASSMRSSSNQELSTKQQKQQQRLNKTIKIAEKIPVLNKYAKIAKAAQKVAAMKNKGGKILGSGDKPASAEEAEDMLAAEQRGEEYKPDQTEQKFTVFSNRQLIISAVLICSGVFIVLIYIAIITMSSITDTAGEAYLASKDNPSEDELAEAYGAQDSGSDSSSSSSESSGNVKSDSTSNIIMVGDSRFVGICSDVYSGSSCSTLGYKKDNVTFIAQIGESYQWLKNTALAEVKKQLDSNKKSTVFINLGTNGLDDTDNYAATYNQLAKDYPDANIVAVNVPPIIDEYTTDYRDVENDANVVKFNAALKSKVSSDVIYCDVYSKLKGKVNAPDDGVHYDEKSSKLFNDEMLNCIKTSGSSSSSSSSFDSLLSKGGTSVDELNQKSIKQLVVVESSGSSANVSFYENVNNSWKVDSSLNASGYVGSNGTTSSPSEGKSATPKGLYGVGDAFYQNSKPSTKLGSFKITSNTYWVDDPNSKYYNQKVEGTSNKDWSSAEHMSEISSYKYGFVINYNMNPVKKGAGSAIFFHISHNSPTAGCVSVSEDKVLSYLAKLDKSKKPYILII